MAQALATDSKLFQRPLYIFDLPEEILYTLQLKAQPATLSESPSPHFDTPTASPSPSDQDKQHTPASATSCALCGLTFTNLLEQRGHVRSDLHGYNIKQKLRGKKPVNELEFERLVGQLDESISGSDTTDSEDDDDHELSGAPKTRDTTISALLKRQAKLADGDAEDAPMRKRNRGAGKPPLFWFTASKLPANVSLGVYRSIFSLKEQEREEDLVEVVKQKQLAAKPPPNPLRQKKQEQEQEDEGGVPLPVSMLQRDTSASGPHYFLCMIGGGHFAGMIVSLTPKLIKKAGAEDRSATVIAHKTFHRYTTRRKQGGSQSANDNSKGNAHSAGSSLRRYNETALVEEVRALLAEWKELIDNSDLLFIRATGSTNRRTLFGPYDGQVLNHKDERLRGFPFNTRRATQSELMRAFVELTRVKVSNVDEAELARKQAAEDTVAQTKVATVVNSKTSTPATTKLSKAEEEAGMHTTQLYNLIRRSKAPPMLSHILNNSLSPDFQFFPPESHHHAPTPLHLAAASNSPACVTSLLLKAGSNPAARNAEGKSPYEIAGDRATRDAFRLARAQLGEDRWNWDVAGVGSALSQADADARAAREKDEKSAEEAAEKRRRQAEAERLRREDTEKEQAGRERTFGRGHVLEKPKLTAEERRREEARGMSEEMRMKLEREKRARAAEERMRRLQGK